MEWKLIESEKDFIWYTKALDVAEKYNHQHIGKPEKYPCKVRSVWGDNPNGPYYYEHNFIYQQEVICENCGSKSYIWPEEPDLYSL